MHQPNLLRIIAVAVAVPLVAVFAQKSPPVSTTFKVGADCKIVLADDKAGAVADLKVGNRVRIAYHADGTATVADRIHLVVEKDGTKPSKSPGGAKQDPNELHARGKITAVDATVGTITVDVHQKAATEKERKPTGEPVAFLEKLYEFGASQSKS